MLGYGNASWMGITWFPTTVEEVSGRRGWFLSANLASLDAAESLLQLLPSQGGKLQLVWFQNCFSKDNGENCPVIILIVQMEKAVQGKQ